MKRAHAIRSAFVAAALLAAAVPCAQAAPVEYDATNVWWSRQARSGSDPYVVLGFALPVLSGDRMVGVVNILCPRGSPRGAFLEVPMTVRPRPELQGKQVQVFVVVNGQTFAGHVDNNRFLVYFDDPPLPNDMPGVRAGKSVRAALSEKTDAIQVGLDPKGADAVTIRFNRPEPQAKVMFDNLRGQGLAPVSYDRIVRACDEFMGRKAAR